MSDIVDLNIREQIARIDKLREEARKFAAEQHKLSAEAAKFERERWWSLVIAITALTGGLLGIASFIAKLIS